MSLSILALFLVLLFVLGFWLTSRILSKRRKLSSLSDNGFELDEHHNPECPACKGAGAKNRLGEIYACPECEGTGVVSSLK